MMVSTRQTAAERRVAVLSAAVTEFAKSGYSGTSTDAIAIRAGISQPYLFRLFGTKKDLFIATYDQVGTRIVKELSRAIEGLDREEAMQAMGMAYLHLMQDPEMLQVQMHGYAAATGDPRSPRLSKDLRSAVAHGQGQVGTGPGNDPGFLCQRHVDLGDVRD